VKTLILKGSEVRTLVEPGAAIAAVEQALAGHARGETQMPSKVYIALPEVNGDFRAMPVRIGPRAGVKWINAHPDNPARHGLPSVIGVFILSDTETAAPLAIMDATGLTSLRTGAVSAVATKALAREDAETIGIIGCGVQARSVIDCHMQVMKPREIRLFDLRGEAAERLAAELPQLPCRVVDLETAAGSDVVCTLTPSHKPVVTASMVRNGSHINAMGADAPGKQELDPAIVASARIFLDDLEQASESGEVNVPLRSGLLAHEAIAGTLGEVVAGMKPGREKPEQTTLFDSTGLAVQDLAVAGMVYDRALELGVGVSIELVDES
jgi:alanine dehydrogenase